MAAHSCSRLNHLILHLVLCSSLLFILSTALHSDFPEGYVVYMGSSAGSNADAQALEAEHLELLSSVLPSEEKQTRRRLIHSYSHAFRGFSAMLTQKEASELSERSGVVSVFRDRVLPLHTTRSWDFLDSESGVFWRRSGLPASSDVIIGIIDTGVWPESPSFNDAGMGKIPAKWKGVCMEGPDFKKSHCNRKLIGARYYDSHIDPIHPDHHNRTARDRTSATGGSPRDGVGHGTHTASTAAGAAVLGASYYGLGKGTARGASSSRLAVYKACAMGGCAGSSILKALDDAVADGVDVVSVSIGIGSAFQADFLSDPIAIGALHAHEHGVVVVCSGGNDGPDPGTVVNAAPWIVTVAASSIDRGFEADVVLGDGSVIKGSAITFSNLTRWTPTPLVFGGDIAGDFTPSFEASNCYPGSLDPTKAAGKIVVCVDTDISVSRRVKKLVAQGVGARGLIVVDDIGKGASFDAGTFPFSELSKQDGASVLHYINSTKNPTAAVLPSVDVTQLRPAPVVAFFSSRGPGGLTQSVLKPDLMAPGVGILAAWIPPTDSTDVPKGQRASGFAIKSGTSMSSPHVAGAAAIVKSVHPNWTPSMIRSALMTTATTWSNLGKPLTTSTGSGANYHDTGAGEISPLRALEPGLVFETTTSDYLLFLCHYGYKSRLIASVSGLANFTCPSVVADDLISAINYPSISVSRLDGTVTVRRTVTNVGPSNSTYVATVQAPKGLAVAVRPDKLVFSPHSWKASFDVSFRAAKGAAKGYRFGSITWWDGTHWVRSVFAVNVV